MSQVGMTERRRVRVTGTVQGVGFRPFVYRHAVALGLAGYVRNDSAGVLIEVEGPPSGIAELCRRLMEEPPPLARIEAVEAVSLEPDGRAVGFAILDSAELGAPDVPVSVDTATCAECLAEVDDPSDRRYRYPFTNCTNCGPRYTIVISIPYDRPATTMAGFMMCPACQREYDDPADRRFHAQPNACPMCGPRLHFCDPTGVTLAETDVTMTAAVKALQAGHILAVKGIGGFHLATDATNPAAVAELRRRKARDDKPFAVMVSDLEAARALCRLDAVGEAALRSPRRPIVLAPRREGGAVAPGVAPGLPELGLMLPYTPLHHLLMAGVGRPLVMTSGNLSDEPIAHTDDDAFERLVALVDGVLTHDRGIHIRCDDSVVRVVDGSSQMIRRSRGFAPEPMALPGRARRQVLAVGAELKSTVAVAKGASVVASHHIGDLEHLASYRSFLQALDHLCHLYGISPEVVAHDLHPEYLSTKLALELDLPAWPVQHHHAHIASCLAEHGHTGRVLGLAFDGLGMGTDGTLWGGEFLVADLEGFQRVGHLEAAPMPGGAAAIREPWRMAVTWAWLAVGPDAAAECGRRLDERYRSVLDLVERAWSAVRAGGMRGTVGVPITTSMGRLFDAVAALVGVRSRVTYEGQAAIELEALARTVPRADAPTYPVAVRRASPVPRPGIESSSELESEPGVGPSLMPGLVVLDPRPLVATVLDESSRGTPAPVVAAGFHEGLGRGAAAIALDLATMHGLDTVALSGGVFQNARLTAVIADALRAEGLTVLAHHLVPPNDGGISIGQAAVAALADHPQHPQ